MSTARLRRALLVLGMALAAPVAASVELGTLFHSPEERARLDRLRRGEPEIARAAAPRPGAPTLTGFVKRSDGRHTVWIDGAPVPATSDAGPLFDSKAVRAYAPRFDESLKVERKNPP